MKNLFPMLILSLSLYSCNGAQETENQDRGPQSTTSKSKLQEKLNSYSVDTEERALVLERYEEIKKELIEIEYKSLVESQEDRDQFPDFVDQEDRGIIRLLDGGPLSQVNGGGSYYSFARKTHEYGQGSDIALTGGEFDIGFAGADYGFFTELGDVDINSVDIDDPQIQYMNNHSPSTTRRAHHDYSYDGVTSNGFTYKNSVPALNGMTYVVRSISYGRSDTLVAFQVVRKDEADSSYIIIWKTLKNFPAIDYNGQ